ncbi:MAG TPA: FAD-dependent oxidoreductase, partial [Methylomirabilota bacterium]|nr:FAD-dependent oxidoreductase [Methylomirabilota bacterium]
MSRSPFDFDVAVIGGGSAGYAAAAGTARQGLRTVVIEGGEEAGGLCILRGCMPSKALLYAAEILHLVRQAEVWGLRIEGTGFDFTRVMARKRELIGEFAEHRRRELNSGLFQFIRAKARFRDEHTLMLDSGENLSARNFVISTGSIIAPPPLPRLKEVGYLTSDDALSLQRLPQSMIVLGGGLVGVELAQFFVRFDVKVTLIQRGEHLLSGQDTDASRELEKVFRREGMTVFTGTRIEDAWLEGGLKGVSFAHGGQTVRVAAEEILFALGRIPNTGGLDLENAGVFTEKHRILTNTEMQTTAHHIYAAGDCTGPHEIVHIAVQQGEIAAHNIAHPQQMRSIDYRLLTSVVFTDPQIATVGLTEKEAVARSIPYIAASYPFSDHGKSLIMEAKDGFVKLLADPSSG